MEYLRYQTQIYECLRSVRIHWSKSDTVGIPSVGDTSPFTVVYPKYVLLGVRSANPVKDDGASGGALPIGAIIGGSVGGVFILGFFVCVCKRLRRRGGGAKMARYEQDADGLLRM